MNQATGFRSAATTSQPRRIASNGMAPPPAKGSRTRGGRPSKAFLISSRNSSSRRSDSRPQRSTPPSVSSCVFPVESATSTMCPAISASSFRRASALPGSRRRVASRTALLAASGRLAGHICSVDMCPWRTLFSCTESSDTSRIGKATSMSRVSSGKPKPPSGKRHCGLRDRVVLPNGSHGSLPCPPLPYMASVIGRIRASRTRRRRSRQSWTPGRRICPTRVPPRR